MILLISVISLDADNASGPFATVKLWPARGHGLDIKGYGTAVLTWAALYAPPDTSIAGKAATNMDN